METLTVTHSLIEGKMLYKVMRPSWENTCGPMITDSVGMVRDCIADNTNLHSDIIRHRVDMILDGGMLLLDATNYDDGEF